MRNGMVGGGCSYVSKGVSKGMRKSMRKGISVLPLVLPFSREAERMVESSFTPPVAAFSAAEGC